MGELILFAVFVFVVLLFETVVGIASVLFGMALVLLVKRIVGVL